MLIMKRLVRVALLNEVAFSDRLPVYFDKKALNS
jgi:hypothetical protein